MRRRSSADPSAATPDGSTTETDAPAADSAATAAPEGAATAPAPDGGTTPDAPTTAFPATPPAPAASGASSAPAADAGTTGPTPDGQPQPATTPAAEPAPKTPGFATRGKLRRRLRYLRRVRELGYRDLGGLVFDQHRFARPNENLVQAKVGALAQIDGEVRVLETRLQDRRVTTELREAGIAACPRCGAIHGSESRFCPACGLALSGPTEMAAVYQPTPAPQPASAGYAPGRPAPTPPPTPPGMAGVPAPTPFATQPPTPPAATPPMPVAPPTPVAPPAPVAPPTPVATPAPAPAAPTPTSAPTPTPAPAAPTPSSPEHTIHVRPDAGSGEQPTKILRAADVGSTPVTSGDPLSGPQPAEKPPLSSGDPLAERDSGGDDRPS